MCISKRKLEPFSVGARVISDFLDRRVSIFFNLKSKSLRQKSQKPFKYSQSYDVCTSTLRE